MSTAGYDHPKTKPKETKKQFPKCQPLFPTLSGSKSTTVVFIPYQKRSPKERLSYGAGTLGDRGLHAAPERVKEEIVFSRI